MSQVVGARDWLSSCAAALYVMSLRSLSGLFGSGLSLQTLRSTLIESDACYIATARNRIRRSRTRNRLAHDLPANSYIHVYTVIDVVLLPCQDCITLFPMEFITFQGTFSNMYWLIRQNAILLNGCANCELSLVFHFPFNYSRNEWDLSIFS